MPLGTDEGLRAGDIVLDGDRTSPPPQKRGPSPHFRPMSIVAMQSAGWVKMPLGIEVDRGPGHIMLDGYPALPRKRNSSQQPSPLFDPCLLWPNGCPSQLLIGTCKILQGPVADV